MENSEQMNTQATAPNMGGAMGAAPAGPVMGAPATTANTQTAQNSSNTSVPIKEGVPPEKTEETIEQQASKVPAKTATRIETLLEECVKRNASDLHIQVGLPPILRVDGALIPILGLAPLTEDVIQKLVFSTLDSEQREVLSKDKEFDYSFAFGQVARFRVNAFQERGHLAS